jgi:O-antigen ligase
MVTATQPVRWFQKPLLMAIIVAAVGILSLGTTISGMSGPLFLALIAQVVLFILLLRRPVWAMAALIVSQFTASDYMVPLIGMQISSRFLWTVLALLLLVPIIRKKGWLKLGDQARRVILPAVIFICVVTIANFLNTGVSTTIQYLRTSATMLVIIFLLPAVIRNEKDLKLLALVALITASLSALVGVMQHMGLTSFELLPSENNEYTNRVSGLATDAIQLSFYLPIVIVLTIALAFSRVVESRMKKLLVFSILIMIAGLYFTFTRSGIYSLAPGILAMILIMKSKHKMKLLILFLVLGVGLFMYLQMTNSRYSQGFSDDSSASGRLVMWSAGLNIARDYPLFGIGTYRFQQVSSAYASTIDVDLMEQQGGAESLGEYEAHDDFITVWVSFGTGALLVYLWLFVGIFRNFFQSYRRSSKPFLKAFSLGCFGALAAYILISGTHNALNNTMILWILGGLSIATIRLASAKKLSTTKVAS